MRKLSSLLLSALTCFGTMMAFQTVDAADLTLAQNGTSEYRIVLPENPSPVQISAGNELQAFFKQVTDVELPIVSAAELQNVVPGNDKLFIIGPGDLSAKALNSDAESQIAYDGIIIKSVGNSIVLSGAPERGPLYSVYEFLEKQLGCRWWTSTESTIPHTPNLVVADNLDVNYAPKLIYRESFYRDVFNSPFAARLKCNGNSEPLPDELGGHHIFQYFVHSAYNLIPPQKYFHDHPDWFSEIDGVRKTGFPDWCSPSEEYTEFAKTLKPEQLYSSGAQLCFSNDEMIAEMVKNAREALRKNPKASFLSISQNDWHGYCTCEKCRQIDEEDDSHAGSLLRGVNKVAEALEEEFPNLYVETLAYQYTRKPPKVTKPRKNVVIRLCSIECSFAQPLDSETNQTFRDDLLGWSKIADKLFVWDYATDFAYYLLPFPNYRVIAPNINFYLDHNVVGLFEQGDYHCETGDFVQMRAWVVAKLLWDPSLDQEALRDEYLAGYYAPELVPIYKEYFDALSDTVEQKNYYLSIFKPNTNEWLDLETLNKVTLLQKKALDTAVELEKANPELHKGLVAKVRREQIPIDVVWLLNYPAFKLEAQIRSLDFCGPEDPLQAARDFCAKTKEFGLSKRKEVESPEAFAQYKQDLVNKYLNYTTQDSSAVPSVCENLPRNTWIELQEYDLNLVRLTDLTFSVDDPNASNSRAAMMPGSHFEWATNWPFIENLKYLRPTGEEAETPEFHVYAYVRCDASVDDGQAMTAGVYDEKEKKSVAYKTIQVNEIKGENYTLLDLGVVPLTTTEYLWFAPPKRPGEVGAVYIDNVVLISER